MASPEHVHPLLVIPQVLRKRRSEEVLVTTPKRRTIAPAVTGPIDASSPERRLNDEILADSDDSSQSPLDGRSVELEAIRTKIRAKRRVYRPICHHGEQEQWVWGACCKCELHGNIMTWPKCKHCLHNSCEKCDVSTDKINVDEEERRPSHVEKMEELLGEFEGQLTDMECHSDLPADASDEIKNLLNTARKLNAQLDRLNQSLSKTTIAERAKEPF